MEQVLTVVRVWGVDHNSDVRVAVARGESYVHEGGPISSCTDAHAILPVATNTVILTTDENRFLHRCLSGFLGVFTRARCTRAQGASVVKCNADTRTVLQPRIRSATARRRPQLAYYYCDNP